LKRSCLPANCAVASGSLRHYPWDRRIWHRYLQKWAAPSAAPRTYSYSDRFVDIIAEGFDCAIRVGYLNDSNLIARRVGPVHGTLVASPAYIREHGAPEAPDELLAHQASRRERKPGNFSMATRQFPFNPQGQFKADNGTALAAAAVAGLGIAWLPDRLIKAI